MFTDKFCTKCLTVKPLSYFGKQTSGAYRPHCSSCRVVVQRESLAARAGTDAKARRDLKRHARIYFGLSLEEYLAHVTRLKREQKNRCAICREKNPEHLDHCHKTGRIRGLLCRRCNLAIGFLRDDPRFAAAASDYLTRHRSRRR